MARNFEIISDITDVEINEETNNAQSLCALRQQSSLYCL
jgi:hypothetical protein